MSVGTIIGGASAVSGFLSSRKADKRAGKAQDAQLAVAGRQEDRADEQFELWRDNYLKEDQRIFAQNKELDPQQLAARGSDYDAATAGNEFYKDKVIPAQGRLIDEAAPDYDYVTSKAAADADQDESRRAGIYERSLTESGVDSSSGAATMGKARMARDAAGVRVANITGARERERNSSFNKLATATGRTFAGVQDPQSRNLAGIQAGNLSGAARTYGDVSRQSFNQAGQYAKAAGQGARGVTNAISDFGNIFNSVGSSSYGSNSLPGYGGGFSGSSGGSLDNFNVSDAGGFLADGGPAEPGKTYVVGEEGPEILHQSPDGGGYVEPLNKGAGVQQQPQIDPRVLEDMIRAHLTRGQAGISRSMQS